MPKQLAVSKIAPKRTRSSAKVGATKWDGKQREMVAREAYLSAEKRGFNGGDPVQDWLEAENKVKEMLKMDS